MRFESRAREVILPRIRTAHDAATDDALAVARSNASRNSRTGRFERSLTRTETVPVGRDRLESRIGSPLNSARPKEKGAYIQAKRGPYLVFPTRDGWRKVRSVRLPARPVVTPAGRKFPQLMAARLRQVLG